jgi:hypothetical protein
MTRRSGDAYPDFQSVSHQPTGFSRWSLSVGSLYDPPYLRRGTMPEEQRARIMAINSNNNGTNQRQTGGGSTQKQPSQSDAVQKKVQDQVNKTLSNPPKK